MMLSLLTASRASWPTTESTLARPLNRRRTSMPRRSVSRRLPRASSQSANVTALTRSRPHDPRQSSPRRQAAIHRWWYRQLHQRRRHLQGYHPGSPRVPAQAARIQGSHLCSSRWTQLPGRIEGHEASGRDAWRGDPGVSLAIVDVTSMSHGSDLSLFLACVQLRPRVSHHHHRSSRSRHHQERRVAGRPGCRFSCQDQRRSVNRQRRSHPRPWLAHH